MNTHGFVYILINPSLSGLVKIGKTTRNSEERAKELSDATGVPTPFIVAFDEQFEDCDFAERFIHTLLQQKGYRIAENREFFNIPLKEAIRALIETKNVLSNSFTSAIENIESKDILIKERREIWGDILEQGKAFLYGDDDVLKDTKQAYKILKQAATLGSSEACTMLAEMYMKGQGCRQDNDKAVDYLKEAIRLGDDKNYAPLAKIYYKFQEFDNADKCWKKYFDYLINSASKDEIDFEEHLTEYVSQVRDGGIANKYRDRIKDIIGKDFDDIWTPNMIANQMGPNGIDYIYKDALEALVSLGYKQSKAERVLSIAMKDGKEISVQALLQRALALLSK